MHHLPPSAGFCAPGKRQLQKGDAGICIPVVGVPSSLDPEEWEALHRGLGLSARRLPSPQAGEPGTQDEFGWASTLRCQHGSTRQADQHTGHQLHVFTARLVPRPLCAQYMWGTLFCRRRPNLIKTSFQVSAGSFDRLVLLHLQPQYSSKPPTSIGKRWGS